MLSKENQTFVRLKSYMEDPTIRDRKIFQSESTNREKRIVMFMCHSKTFDAIDKCHLLHTKSSEWMNILIFHKRQIYVCTREFNNKSNEYC